MSCECSFILIFSLLWSWSIWYSPNFCLRISQRFTLNATTIKGLSVVYGLENSDLCTLYIPLSRKGTHGAYGAAVLNYKSQRPDLKPTAIS